jgi:hypothetical protein
MDGMTTLMVLMAGLVLGSDGVERVSTETKQRLCIDGSWEGSGQYVGDNGPGTWKVKLEPGRMKRELTAGLVTDAKWAAEGSGKFRLVDGNVILYGIYKFEAGQLVICFRDFGYGRPSTFHIDRTHNLLILKPVNPPKK